MQMEQHAASLESSSEGSTITIDFDSLSEEQRRFILKGCAEHRMYWSEEEQKFHFV